MKYPNLRYGNPQELAHYAQFIPLPELARRLRRSDRSVRDWLTGRKKVPWWVPEIIRLQNMEHAERMRQMNIAPLRAQLGIVSGAVIAYQPRRGPESGPQAAIDALPVPVAVRA